MRKLVKSEEWELSLKNFKLNKKRTISTIIGIILSVALICAVATMATSFQETLIQNAISETGYYHLKVGNVTDKEKEEMQKIKNVQNIIELYDVGYAKMQGIQNEDKPYVHLYSMRNETFEKMIRLPVKYYSDQSTGALMSRITNDINLVQSSIPTIISMFRAVLTMIGLIGVIIYMNYKLALIAIVLYPIFIFPLSIISKKLRKYSHLGQERMGDLTSVLQESFSGIRVVKAFVAEDKEVERFEKANAQTIKYANKSVLAGNLASPLTEALGSFGIGAVLLMGGYQVISGTSTTGTFIAFLAALVQIYEPVKLFANSNNALQASIAATDRVFSMFDEEDEVIENKGSVECNAEGKDIEFKNVSFKYKDNIYALKNISFNVKAGSTVAFVGPSGAGKTTLAHLIPRFYDVTEGAILIGGINIKDYDLYSLRHNIATVSQDAFLFNDTIRNNISYSKENATDEEIKNAARAAYADEFIENFPEKYDALCGERGVKLSGGQKQRITIARALLKNPPILILDEATSALDTESERVVQKALDNLMKGRTSFVVAHRLSTILNADIIVVFNNGGIEAIGRHEEILVSSPTYKNLYEMQFKVEEMENITAGKE